MGKLIKMFTPPAQKNIRSQMYSPGKEAALVIIVVKMILSFILCGKKDK